jgi:hypothetical protein
MARDVPFSNFQEPIAFPKDKEEPRENRQVESVTLDGLVNQGHSVFISHPVALLLIKMVVLSEVPKFFQRLTFSLSARDSMHYCSAGKVDG